MNFVLAAPWGSGPGTSLSFLGQNFVPSSDVGSDARYAVSCLCLLHVPVYKFSTREGSPLCRRTPAKYHAQTNCNLKLAVMARTD